LGKSLSQRLTEGNICHRLTPLPINKMSRENRNAKKHPLRKIAFRSKCKYSYISENLLYITRSTMFVRPSKGHFCLRYRRELTNGNRHVLSFHPIGFVCLEMHCVECVSNVLHFQCIALEKGRS